MVLWELGKKSTFFLNFFQRIGSGERSLTPGLSDVQEGEVVHRKLEGAAERYNSLLKSQLEQQRAFYEELG